MRTISRTTVALSALLTLAAAGLSQTGPLPSDLVPIASSEIPAFVHTYYSLQNFSSWPPLPFNWLDDPEVQFYVSASGATSAIYVNDLQIDYAQRRAAATVLRMAARAAEGLSVLADEEEDARL